MPLVNMSDMLNHAYRNGYAVGGFDIVSLDFLDAIIDAAETTRSPVILSISESISSVYKLDHAIAAAENIAKHATVPVAINFNHGTSFESAVQAINAGCNGVMLDTSRESFPVNITNTSKVVKMAHDCGISVEGELGNNLVIEDTVPGKHAYTAVAEAKAYVERTNVDFLAVAIGTSQTDPHKQPKPDFERLKRINSALEIPLVIHDSRHLNEEKIHKLIKNGVAKINYHTGIIENLTSIKNSGYIDGIQNMREIIRTNVERCMINWGSAGRAAEVMVRCEAWSPIHHVIIYNADNQVGTDIEEIMAKGQTILSKIPGVRRVIAGNAVHDKRARYKFCWLIEFVHKNVIESYRDNHNHVDFANSLFKRVSSDRISINYTEADVSQNLLVKPLVDLTASA